METKKLFGIIGIVLAVMLLFGCTQQNTNQTPQNNTQPNTNTASAIGSILCNNQGGTLIVKQTLVDQNSRELSIFLQNTNKENISNIQATGTGDLSGSSPLIESVEKYITFKLTGIKKPATDNLIRNGIVTVTFLTASGANKSETVTCSESISH